MQNYYQRPPMRPPYQNTQPAFHGPGAKGSCPKDKADGFPLAMAYVPWQRYSDPYPVCKAFVRGTIFEALDKPFMGKGGCRS